MKYFIEAKRLWKALVPKNGQADSVQGELIRAIEKPRDEAQRNGNINWDKGHVILSNFALKHLTEEASFSEADKLKIKRHISRIQDYDSPYTDDDIYDDLVDYVVMWSLKHKELVPNPKNPELDR